MKLVSAGEGFCGVKRAVELLSYLAVLIHSRIECATDRVLGLEDLNLKGFGAKGAVRLQQVLGSSQAARASANDSNLSYGLHGGWYLEWIMMFERCRGRDGIPLLKNVK